MGGVVLHWAGRDRLFHLRLGEILDLEQACNLGAGAIYQTLVTGTFRAMQLVHVIRLGLIGGGMDELTAKLLVDEHFERKPMLAQATIAAEIMMATMVGIEPDASTADSAPREAPGAPLKFASLVQICREFNMSPQDLRDLRYSDFINLLRGWNAARNTQVAAPTEEEFLAMLKENGGADV